MGTKEHHLQEKEAERQVFEKWIDRLKRPGMESAAQEPYLRVNAVDVYVRDQSLSRQFYLEKLGFRLLFDTSDSQDEGARRLREEGQRWVAVAPMISSNPMFGGSVLGLVKPAEGSEQARRIGTHTGISFLTENIAAKHREWAERGVHFEQAPTPVPWGLHAIFADLDGNRFDLVQSPWFVYWVETERRATEERQERRRRAIYEIAMAKEVQSRLFPQRMPPLRTLSYAGECIQARHVGGDYYDFLDLGGGRLGLVVGDVAGKGLAAALLMANLQANLRSQYALALDDLENMLKSVNRLFYENTSDASYATLFFGDYDDRSRRLRYVNCGHFPPLVVRPRGSVERLPATSTVLGLFPKWECVIAETRLEAGDSLVLYSDGVTEALSDEGKEFGESRLVGLLSAHAGLAPDALLRTIVKAVQEFSGREMEDDLTLVIARCRCADGGGQ
jgi:phosphoserine phosphatase RsbU/P